MHRRRFRALTVAVGAVLCTVAAAPAQAQVWLQDRALTEGRGIRTGNFELHPGIGAEIGYDSNVFYRAASPTSALRLRVTPSLYLSTLGAARSANSDSATTALPSVNFRGGVAVTYHDWFALAGTSNVDGLRNIGGLLGMRFDFLPGRTWQFALSNDFTRTIQAATELDPVTSASFAATGQFNRNYNVAGFELAYAPGRATLEWRLGYNLIASWFDDDARFGQFNYLGHEINSRLRWRFLPKTAVVWEAAFTPTSYTNAGAGSTGLFSSYPIRTRAGLNGLITEKIQLTVLAGYHGTFFSGGDNADTVIGQAELRWIISGLTSLRVGFQRDVQGSFFGNFYIRNRGYANFQQSFGGRLLLSIEGAVGYYEYGYLADRNGARGTIMVAGSDPTDGRFTAARVEGTAFGEYRFSEVFGLNLTLRGAANLSEVRFGNITDRDGGVGQAIAWTRFEAFLGARLNW